MSKKAWGARSGLTANPRDNRIHCGPEALTSLPNVSIGRYVEDSEMRAYLQEVREVNSKNNNVRVAEGKLFAQLVSPAIFLGLVLPDGMSASQGSSLRNTRYGLRNVKKSVAGTFSTRRIQDRELATRKFEGWEALAFEDPEAYDQACKSGLVKGNPQDYEKWSDTSAAVRRQPVKIGADALGLSLQGTTDQGAINDEVIEALVSSGISERAIAASGLAKFSPLLIPILTVDTGLTPERSGSSPVMPAPPREVNLGPLMITELEL